MAQTNADTTRGAQRAGN
jgi:hypothetical protein